MDSRDKERIHALWDELSLFGAANSDGAMKYLLQTLSELIDAKQAFWIGTVRLGDPPRDDPLNGWRPRSLYYLYPIGNENIDLKTQSNLIEMQEVDPSLVANVQRAGQFRVNIKHEIVPPEWFTSAYYKTFFEPLKIRDFIYVVTPIGPDVESWLGFNRIADEPSFFGDKDRKILDYAVRPLRWLHQKFALHHGLLLVGKPLTAAERRVLNGLLSDKTEQAIAVDSGLSPSTVHTYCVRICRKFGVRGRAGLMAMWLGQLPDD